MKIIFIIFAGIVFFSSFLPACSDSQSAISPTTTPPQTTTANKPQYGGILKIIVSSGVTPLGSPSEGLAINTDYARIVAPAMETLLRHDNSWRLKPRLAESWQVSPDGKTITLSLRKGIKFQDGTPFNAEAVKYNLQNYAPNNVIPDYLKLVTAYDIIDDYTLRLTLTTFNSNLLLQMCYANGVMASPTAMKVASTPEKMTKDHTVGTGAFKYVMHTRDVSMKYEKADSYWQKDKPYLDGLEWMQIADITTALMSFRTGEAQVLFSVQPKDARELATLGYNISLSDQVAIRYFVPDGANKDSPFADKRVRQAVEYAIDKKKIAEVFGFGYYEAVTQFAASKDATYDPSLRRDYDPIKAKQLLTEAGYSNGFKTKIIAQTTEDKNFIVSIQSFLKSVGIDAEIELVDRTRITTIIREGWNNGLLFAPYPINAGLPLNLERFFGTAGALVIKNMLKPVGWQDTLSASITQVDDNKRTTQVKELIKIMYDEAMGIPILGAPTIIAQDKKVHDAKFQIGHGQFFEPQDAWLSK